MTRHILHMDKERFFREIEANRKRHEVRVADRWYEVGDVLDFLWRGKRISRVVTYISEHRSNGVLIFYILSIAPAEDVPPGIHPRD